MTEIVSTKAYERAIRKMLSRNVISEEDRDKMEDAIIADPTSPAIIPGTGGIRKLKWKGSGRGKRGGIRTIYFHHVAPGEVSQNDKTAQDVIFLLTAYPKSIQEDLSPTDKKAWKRFVDDIKKEQERQ